MNKTKIVLIFLLLTLVFVNGNLFSQFLFDGRVIKIQDGDTLTVRSGEVNFRVRLHGIDAPERGQPYSVKAKELLEVLVAGKNITIKVMDVDRYGRLIGLIFMDDLLVNLELLKEGLAWHYFEYDDTPEFAQAEEEARRYKLGLWIEPNPVAPWDWRKK